MQESIGAAAPSPAAYMQMGKRHIRCATCQKTITCGHTFSSCCRLITHQLERHGGSKQVFTLRRITKHDNHLETTVEQDSQDNNKNNNNIISNTTADTKTWIYETAGRREIQDQMILWTHLTWAISSTKSNEQQTAITQRKERNTAGDDRDTTDKDTCLTRNTNGHWLGTKKQRTKNTKKERGRVCQQT